MLFMCIYQFDFWTKWKHRLMIISHMKWFKPLARKEIWSKQWRRKRGRGRFERWKSVEIRDEDDGEVLPLPNMQQHMSGRARKRSRGSSRLDGNEKP
jgi:hypothetical protein